MAIKFGDFPLQTRTEAKAPRPAAVPWNVEDHGSWRSNTDPSPANEAAGPISFVSSASILGAFITRAGRSACGSVSPGRARIGW